MPDGISAACKDFLVRHTHTPCLCSTRHHSWPLRSPHRVGPVFRQFKCFNKEPRWRFAPTQLLQVRADTEHRQTGRLNLLATDSTVGSGPRSSRGGAHLAQRTSATSAAEVRAGQFIVETDTRWRHVYSVSCNPCPDRTGSGASHILQGVAKTMKRFTSTRPSQRISRRVLTPEQVEMSDDDDGDSLFDSSPEATPTHEVVSTQVAE